MLDACPAQSAAPTSSSASTPRAALAATSYEVIDTNLPPEAKGRALIQLCLYSQLLKDAQGLLPESMRIILGDGTEDRFATVRYLAHRSRRRKEKWRGSGAEWKGSRA